MAGKKKDKKAPKQSKTEVKPEVKPEAKPDAKAEKPPIIGGIGYIFDIIVVRLDITDKEAKALVETDKTLLAVNATFNSEQLKITSSRINVIEFKSGKSFEFIENPSTLRDDLSKNKFKLRVLHGTKELGVSIMDWPESFINCLVDPACGTELTHVFESEFKNCDSGKLCGVIEVIVRLQTKCTDWRNEDICTQPQNLCKEANKIIDPNDVLFVVGEDRNPCCCAQVGLIPATDSDRSLNPTCLDLSNFRAVNGQTVPNTDILSCRDPACAEMENLTNQYQQMIDSLMKKNRHGANASDSAKQNANCPRQQEPSTSRQRAGRSEVEDASHSSSDMNVPCCCGMDDDAEFAGNNVIHRCQAGSVPELVEKMPVSSRCCPLCQENLNWLPKLAACPKCGYKPIPEFDEKPYDETATAEQILRDFLQRKSSCTEQKVSEHCFPKTKESCRCTCKPNKMCANCRVRKLCADVLQTNQNDKCGKCEDNDSADMYNVCNTESKDCRPHLSRVFSDLKDLYDIKESKRKGLEVDERCEKELQKEKAQHSSKGKGKAKKKTKVDPIEEDRKEYLVENFGKSGDVCKSKNTYNYNAVRKYPGNKMGHKTCINGFAGRKNVPAHMGWLWNVEATGDRSGWKPGAIRKPIKELMKYFLKDFPADTLRVSQYSYRKSGNKDRDDICEDLVQKPTLHICKKNAEYYITLRPLKDPTILKDCADPYLDMKPIQFRITKNPLLTEKRKLKQCLKDMGFDKCTCHKPIIYCYCRSFLDKKRLEYQCNKEARNRNIPPCCDSLVLSDTSDSEAEFDFSVTPPAGVIKPERLKRRNYVNTATQYVENDWNIPPLFPKEPNKYMKLYNCAIGGRFGPEFGPYGGEGFGPGAVPAGGVYGPCAGRGGKARGPKIPIPTFGAKGKAGAGDGKGSRTVDMMRYLTKSKGKLSAAEQAERRKKRMRELSGMPPPILCMVDRRGKPVDPCAPMPCYPCDPACARDDRIC